MKIDFTIDKKKLKAMAMIGQALPFRGSWRKSAGSCHCKQVQRPLYNILGKDLYDENLWELVSSTIENNPQVAVETNLRARTKVIRKTYDTQKFPSLDS